MASVLRTLNSRYRLACLIGAALVLAVALWMALTPQPTHRRGSRNVGQAQNDCMQLSNAVRAFYQEYATYPVRGDREGPHRTDGTSMIMEALMASKSAEAAILNKRHLPFLEPSKVAKTADSYGYHSGTGRFNDPWGRPYEIYFDADADGESVIPSSYSSKFGRLGSITRPVFVHSGGPDKNLSTIEDNVTSLD